VSEDAGLDRRTRWIIRGGVLLLRLLGSTWRYRLVDRGGLERARREGRPVILALWHGQLLPLLWLHRGEGVSVLISEHRDGEIVAQVAEAIGLRTVRGSTSRNAARALVGLVRELQSGHEIAITPDGPRGPARRFAPGALVASQRSGAPVVAIGVSCARAWHLRSWDRFMIPKPFARITVAYSEPTVAVAETPREAAEQAARFEALLEGSVARAER
jgi:lysophospholipid acyltransferase (LPLAT)-like uncharacterized protein